jgi:hypothetical protein
MLQQDLHRDNVCARAPLVAPETLSPFIAFSIGLEEYNEITSSLI